MSSYWAMFKEKCADTAIEKAFAYIDVDGSGFISASDLKTIMETINSYITTGIDPTEQDLDRLIKIADIDGNGKLSLDEIKDLFKKTMNMDE